MRNLYTQFYRTRFSYLILATFLCLASCQADSDKKENKEQYFDVASFFQQEASRLATENPEVSKTVFLNGKEEQKKLSVNDWQSELNAFLDADINKKSFLGKYIPEQRKEGTQTLLHYSAVDENLRIRALDVAFDNDSIPVKIHAVLFTSNILYSSHQQLTYERDKGYWISGKQTIRFLEPDTFSIAAIFHP